MNLKLISSTFFVCIISIAAFSQDYDKGEYLKSMGNIPLDFTKLSSEKYQEQAEKINKNAKAKIKRSQRDFLLESNFLNDEVLTSGEVLFNDPLSQYVYKVANVLLAKNKPLKDSLRFYILKSSAVNAFTTNEGIIFVNIGLLSHLKSEAELAFVLSHEIVHFQAKHSMKEYVDERTNKDYKEMSLEDRVLSKCNFSKEQETEADLRGLQMYLDAGYATESLDGFYDLLRYGYLPFEEKLFKKSFFETDNLKFPSTYDLAVINSVTTGVDYDDSKSTHPNVEKRRSYITQQSNVLSRAKKGKKFIVGEKEFNAALKTARFEMNRLYIADRDYIEAIYNSYLLLQTNPKSKYLKMSVMYGLYFLTKYHNRNDKSDVTKSYNDVEGDSQPLYYLIDQLSKEELNATATVYAWKLKKEFPGNKYIDSVAYDLVEEMVTQNNMKPDDFSANPKKKKESTNKYPSYVKRAPSAEELEEEKQFMKYAFVDILDNPEFVKAFYIAEQKKKDFEIKKYSYSYKKQQKAKQAIIEKKGYAMGADKVVFVSPDFKKVDLRKKMALRFMASEQALLNFNKRIIKTTSSVGIQSEILEPKAFNSPDIQKFNDYAVLCDWFQESHDFPYFSMFQPEMEQIATRYGTKNFCKIGTVSLKEKKDDAAAFILASIVYFPLLPYAIYNAATPRYYTYYYCYVYDIVSGKMMLKNQNLIHLKDQSYVLNSNIYSSVQQMKYKRKQK